MRYIYLVHSNLLAHCTSRVIRLEAPGSVGAHSPPPHRHVFVKISDQVSFATAHLFALFCSCSETPQELLEKREAEIRAKAWWLFGWGLIGI